MTAKKKPSVKKPSGKRAGAKKPAPAPEISDRPPSKVFDDCEIHMMPQRSDSWFSIRKGVLTASTLGAWIWSETTASARKARESAICKLIAETADCWRPKNYTTEAMQRGTDLEPEAVESFQSATGLTVSEVGFCLSKFGAFGCSPDGLMFDNCSGLESKAPIPETHIKYRRAGELPSEYELQVLMSMAVTGAESWYFQSYNPGLVNLRVKVERCEKVETLKAQLIQFSEQLGEAIEAESRSWREEFEAKLKS